jgi:hypothetical protein
MASIEYIESWVRNPARTVFAANPSHTALTLLGETAPITFSVLQANQANQPKICFTFLHATANKIHRYDCNSIKKNFSFTIIGATGGHSTKVM